MAALDDLVHETSTSTGTGNVTLSNVDGRQSFNAAFGTGGLNVFYYFISHRAAGEWEVGTGHLLNATTLVRDTVLASSNAGSAVNFTAGTKDVANDLPAALHIVSLLTTRGDLITRNASDPIRLGIGAAERILQSNGTDPAWVDPRASQANQEAGSDLTTYVVSGRQHFHPSAAKGWVKATDGGTLSIDASYNVSSVDDDGAGNYGVNWGTDFSSANYCAVGTALHNAVRDLAFDSMTAGAIEIQTRNVSNNLSNSNGLFVAAFGDQ